MLETIDLTKRIDKQTYKQSIIDLRLKLGKLQRQAQNLKIPVIILFEGWDAAGKGSLINELILSLDPRGFTVYSMNKQTEDEKLRPFLWQFWIRTPAKGRIAIFDRSWYGQILENRVEKQEGKKNWRKTFEFIQSFENQLADDETVIIKFFLHISKKEQKKRLKKIERTPAMAWKVTKQDWKHHKKYDQYLHAGEEIIEKTDADFARWIVIEATDRRFATMKIYKTVIETLDNKINKMKNLSCKQNNLGYSIPSLKEFNSSILNQVDLSKTMTREEYKKLLKKYQIRLGELQHELYTKRIPLLILYEGWDAAGKGGNIRRLIKKMDPRGYEVIPIAAPNDIERAHHYLWRFWKSIPKAGHVAIFDRTWYGRVLVERVEGLCSNTEWKRAYKEMNQMEEQFIEAGTVIVKFWLHIDKDEQLKRFQARQNSPDKSWKITDEDWRNREKWDIYEEAVDEMLVRTSTTYAPWTVIESNCKYFARIKTLKTVIQELEKRL